MKIEQLRDKLEDNGTYKLTKLKVKNEQSRAMSINDSITGIAIVLGKRLIVDDGNESIVTSSIESVEENENSFVITTKNSLYTLTKENN